MSKKRKKKSRRSQRQAHSVSKRAQSSAHDNTGQWAFHTSEYAITDEPMHDPTFEKLPRHVRKQYEKLHDLIHRNPRQAIPPLENLLQNYPHIRQFYNLLGVTYSRIGDDKKADVVILKNYELHPDYLFAKCNYAERCLQKGEPEKIPLIFDNKFDLKMLYPGRKVFHITEVISFMGIMGQYFCQIGQQQVAELYCDILYKLAPEHPITRHLRHTLQPSRLSQLLAKLAGKPKQ